MVDAKLGHRLPGVLFSPGCVWPSGIAFYGTGIVAQQIQDHKTVALCPFRFSSCLRNRRYRFIPELRGDRLALPEGCAVGHSVGQPAYLSYPVPAMLD